MGEQPQGLLLTCPSTSKDPSEEMNITSLERETKVGSGEMGQLLPVRTGRRRKENYCFKR